MLLPSTPQHRASVTGPGSGFAGLFFLFFALGHAAHNFDLPMIRLLLAAGADPQATDDGDDTARDKLPPRDTQDPDAWDEVMELLGRRRKSP